MTNIQHIPSISGSQEIWKNIPNFPGYEVSNLGKVRSFWVGGGDKRFISKECPKIMNQIFHKQRGYFQICLKKNKKQFCKLIHWLVLAAFVGPRPTGMQGCHADNNKINNHLDNLRWDTPGGNAKDRPNPLVYPNAAHLFGDNNGRAIFTNSQILEIRRLAKILPKSEIVTMFKVKRHNLNNILARRTWSHI